MGSLEILLNNPDTTVNLLLRSIVKKRQIGKPFSERTCPEEPEKALPEKKFWPICIGRSLCIMQ
jgi:hypothetical protein